jgi:hypothetical protein
MQSNPLHPRAADYYTRIVLTVIAILLGIIAFRPIVQPGPVSAQSSQSYIYVEPRVTTLRKPDGTQQVEGRVVIDLRNGDIWGFPTLSALPYPVDTIRSQPPVSTPMYLGRFDFSKMTPEERQKALK